MSRTEAKSRSDVMFEAEGRNASKFRADVSVPMRKVARGTDFRPTDEGALPGGDGTAPVPLVHVTSGLSACIMSRLRAFSKRFDFDVTEFFVDCRGHWQAHQHGNLPYVGSLLGVTIGIDLRGSASKADKRGLITAVEKGRFIEVRCKPGIVKRPLKVGDGWVEV